MTTRTETESLRRTLATRARQLVATFVLIPRVEIVELAAEAGFDGVILDLEHAPIGVSDLPPLLAAARGAGIFGLVRVPSGSAVEIGQALDAGADGVLAPHVQSALSAAAVVAAGRFPPAGARSINPYVRGRAYGLADTALTLAATDERVALIAMVEGGAALRELDRICAVDGLDGLFVGPVDLSADLGHPGEPEHPEVVATIVELLNRVDRLGGRICLYAPNALAASRWLDAGAALVAVSADSAMAGAAFAATLSDVQRERP